MSWRAGPLLCLLLLLSAPFLTAGGKQSDVTELKFWHSVGTQNKETLVSLIEEFNQSQPHLRVQGVFQGDEESLYRKLLAPEQSPDLALVPVHFLPDLQDRGYLAGLDSFIPDDLKSDIQPKFWESVSRQGSIYGIPFQYTSHILYVNQHLLRISGSRDALESGSWNRLQSIARRIRSNTQGNWSIFVPMENLIHFTAYVESFTGEPLYRNGRLKVDGEGAVQAMRFLQDLVYGQKLMPPRITAAEAQQLFLSGNMGILTAPSSLLAFHQSNLPFNMTVWHLPYQEPVRPLITGYCLVVMNNANVDTNLVMHFIEHMTSYSSIIKWHTHTGTPAIRNSAKGSIDLLIFYEENPQYTAPIIELERGRIYNPDFDFLQYNIIIKDALARIMLNNGDPGRILQEVQQRFERIERIESIEGIERIE